MTWLASFESHCKPLVPVLQTLVCSELESRIAGKVIGIYSHTAATLWAVRSGCTWLSVTIRKVITNSHSWNSLKKWNISEMFDTSNFFIIQEYAKYTLMINIIISKFESIWENYLKGKARNFSGWERSLWKIILWQKIHQRLRRERLRREKLRFFVLLDTLKKHFFEKSGHLKIWALGHKKWQRMHLLSSHLLVALLKP